jgi:hypothetical protein
MINIEANKIASDGCQKLAVCVVIHIVRYQFLLALKNQICNILQIKRNVINVT